MSVGTDVLRYSEIFSDPEVTPVLAGEFKG
jgi:hypothetical protein